MASFGICGIDGATVEHLIPILTFFDSLKNEVIALLSIFYDLCF